MKLSDMEKQEKQEKQEKEVNSKELSLPPTNEMPRPPIPNPGTQPDKGNGKETDKKE